MIEFSTSTPNKHPLTDIQTFMGFCVRETFRGGRRQEEM